jgi:hypothetical protein
MINALVATAGLDAPIVASPLGAPINAITGLRGGRVLDTQRRRRNDIAEDYRLLAL